MRRIASLALFLTVLVAGCGGGSEETTTPVPTNHGDPPPSKAEFIGLADAICRNHQSRREDLESQAGELGRLDSKAKARQVAGLLRQESANRRAEIDELQALVLPGGDATAVDTVISLIRTEADVLDRWAKAYDELDAAQIRSLQIRLGVTAARAADNARVYGFAVCGQG